MWYVSYVYVNISNHLKVIPGLTAVNLCDSGGIKQSERETQA